MITKINMPKNVRLIIDVLGKAGFDAYAVGGCVRDVLLNREPNDWDITTSALPHDVKGLFRKTIDTGIIHGTVTIMLDRVGYEVTTYRIDGEYEDGRRPKNVEFTDNLIEDLKRRDFTINALAYNDKRGLVDAFDGIGDMDRKIIRCVGNPYHRFDEDALRILRAVRFAAGLDFEIEENTRKAIVELAQNLNKISKERIQAELEKLLMSDHPEKLMTAYDTGVTRVVLPQFDMDVKEGYGNVILEHLVSIEKNHYLRWSVLLMNTDREKARKILRGLKFDNKTVDIVSRLVEAGKKEIPIDMSETRISIYQVGEDIYELYLKYIYEITDESGKDDIKTLEDRYKKIIENGDCISMKQLAVNGKDLVELGVAHGKAVGDGLNMLLQKVLADQSLNQKETLINIFKDTFS